MRTPQLACLCILALVSIIYATPNQYNPNFNYPEKFKVDKAAAAIPYKGEINTGYLNVNKGKQSKIFYILFPAGGATNPAATVDNNKPLMLWIQGGPGCSAATGNYGEIGPIRIVKQNGKLVPVIAPVHWNDDFNLLFVDNPIGVGYSVSENERPNNSMDAAHSLENFLARFFELYPNLHQNDFHIFGESYAGHYIPALTTNLIQNISKNKLKLKTIGIGNGWTDAYHQITAFHSFGVSASILEWKSKDVVRGLEDEAQKFIRAGELAKATKVFDNITEYISTINGNMNIYNFEQYNRATPLFSEWLDQADVKKAYGVDPQLKFQRCVFSIYQDFAADISMSYAKNVSYLLDQTVLPDLKVLLYSGQNDVICSTDGILNYIKNMDWKGKNSFIRHGRSVLRNHNKVIGNYKKSGKLAFATIYDAGHMVPMDQPESAKVMLDTFMKDRTRGDDEENQDVASEW